MKDRDITILKEARDANDHRDGFRSYVPGVGGGKGSNFTKINLMKRVARLTTDGYLATTPHGYEITTKGRELLT